MQIQKVKTRTEQRVVMDSVRQIVRGLRVSSRGAERDLGISGAQIFVLQILAQNSPLTINELAERTRTHQSSVSIVVKRLEKRNLVARTASEKDARRVEASITAKGRKLTASAQPLAQERLLAALDALSGRELSALATLIEKVVVKAGFNKPNPPFFFEDDESMSSTKKKALHASKV
jgi:DNA-binding MarR family transcriptional regulator